MKKVLAAGALGLSAAFMFTVPTFASTEIAHSQKVTNWANHDTAVYVVSTLNLLRTKNGQPMATQFTRRMKVVRYDVYSDNANSTLYFIELRRANGSLAAVFAYQMGSVKPTLIQAGRHFAVNHANDQVVLAYHTDARTLIGSFASTMPS